MPACDEDEGETVAFRSAVTAVDVLACVMTEQREPRDESRPSARVARASECALKHLRT